jgi:hypothetical protein
VAFKNVIARVGPKFGLSFVLKKAGLVIGAAVLGTTGALLLGVLGVFAGSLVGTKLGRKLLEMSFAVAKADLLLHGKRMALEIPRIHQSARTAIEKVALEHRDQCEAALRRNRRAAYMRLLRLRRAEDEAIDQFLNKRFPELLDGFQARHGRNNAHLRRHVESHWLSRLFHAKETRSRLLQINQAFAQANARRERGRACLQADNRWKRLGQAITWFGEVTVYSIQMSRAVEELKGSLREIEAQRAREVTAFAQSEVGIARSYRDSLHSVCQKIVRNSLEEVCRETNIADQKIKTVESCGRDIGITVEITKSWVAA